MFESSKKILSKQSSIQDFLVKRLAIIEKAKSFSELFPKPCVEDDENKYWIQEIISIEDKLSSRTKPKMLFEFKQEIVTSLNFAQLEIFQKVQKELNGELSKIKNRSIQLKEDIEYRKQLDSVQHGIKMLMESDYSSFIRLTDSSTASMCLAEKPSKAVELDEEEEEKFKLIESFDYQEDRMWNAYLQKSEP